MTGAVKRTPWSTWFRSAVQGGVSPEAFWRLSLKEWRALTTNDAAIPAMSRETLQQLVARLEEINEDDSRK